jgi:Ca-activated chloride channel family protein
VFTMTVGNLMPGDVVTIALTLSGPLPIDDGEVTWQFPLVVAPRYMPGAALPGEQAGLGIAHDTTATPDASRISPPVLLPGLPSPVRLGVRLTIDGGGLPLSGLRANLAEVEARADGATWLLALRPGQRLDRDLVLRWRLGGAALTSSAVWRPDPVGGEGGTVAITLVPPVGLAAAGRPRDVAIILDRSGSMEGWKMVAARRASARIVDSLTERDRFAVIAFDDRIETPRALGGALATATDRHRFRAVEFLAGVESRGGTELAQPLALAASLLRPDSGRDQVLVLVTDGQVGNEDQLIASLGRSLGHLRVFTLGIDQAVNAGFLRKLAALGGGACELVESEERLDEVMAKIHRRVATPVVTDLALHAPWLDAGSVAPRRLPAVFAGAPVTILARARTAPRPGELLELTGRLPAGGPLTLRLAVEVARAGVDLEACWARAHLRDLEDRFACGETYLEPEIVRVSKRHRVLSRFTAFIAVDRSVVVNPGGGQRQVVQPVETPAGWGDTAARPPTRTRAAAPTGAPMPRSMPAPMPSAMPSAPMPARMAASPDDLSFEEASFDDGAMAESTMADAMFSRDQAGPLGGGWAHRPQSAGAPPPPAPAKAVASKESAKRSRANVSERREREEEARAGAIDPRPYLARVRDLADELAGAATVADPEIAAQLPISRLTELLDDLNTVGLHDLAAALLPHARALLAALGTTGLAAALIAAAAALRAVTDGPPGTAPTASPPRRRSFWK